jgi:two-component system nitrate/nitrite response regulator NarL
MRSSGRKHARILVAADPPTRLGIRISINGLATICAEAGTAAEAIELAELERPDVCLIGFEMLLGGLQAVHEISVAVPDAAIVVVTDQADPDDLLACVRAGAIGYLPASSDRTALGRALRAVLAGQALVPRSMVHELVRELQTMTRSGGGLTSREAQVLAMLRRGHHTSMIAHRLDISPITVRRHLSTIMRKTGAHDRAELLSSSVNSADVRLARPPSSEG